LTEPLYITASCRVSENCVSKDNEVLFENKGVAVQPFLVSVYEHLALNYPRFYKMDNLCKLGWLAAEILLSQSFDRTQYQPEDIGLLMANRSSSLDTDIRYFETVKTMASPALFVYTLPNIVLGEICIRHHFKGENDFFIFDQFDAGFMQQYTTHLFTSGAVQAAICGWVEIMGKDFTACLWLVEKRSNSKAVLFTEENIHQIYQTSHG
jgi:hypothetical protein